MQVILTEKEYLKLIDDQVGNYSFSQLAEKLIDMVKNEDREELDYSSKPFKERKWEADDEVCSPFDGGNGKWVEKNYVYNLTITKVEL